MNVPNLSRGKVKYQIGSLSKKSITDISRKNKFEQRKNGKLTAWILLLSFMDMISRRGKSYSDWAGAASLRLGKTVSRQAVFERMTQAWKDTIGAVLQEVIIHQARKQVKTPLYSFFGNIWIQDSTTFHLPDVFKDIFRGNYSNGKTKSLAKLNIILDAVSGLCTRMELTSFTVSEQKLSTEIIHIAREGDLVIRDQGYFVLDVFDKLQKDGIYFLSRLKYGVGVFDAKTGKPIALGKVLKGKRYYDKDVMLGNKKSTKVRIVAIKLSPEQGEQRKRKASKDRDRRLNHSEDYYALLDYIIFITNVGNEVWSYKQVGEAYRLRWNIEILFKSWKSGMKIKDMLPEEQTTRTARLETVLYLFLLYISWFQMLIYVPLRWCKELQGRQLSIIKLTKYIVDNIWILIENALTPKIRNHIIYHCCYEKRHDRLNADERLQMFFLKLA